MGKEPFTLFLQELWYSLCNSSCIDDSSISWKLWIYIYISKGPKRGKMISTVEYWPKQICLFWHFLKMTRLEFILLIHENKITRFITHQEWLHQILLLWVKIEAHFKTSQKRQDKFTKTYMPPSRLSKIQCSFFFKLLTNISMFISGNPENDKIQICSFRQMYGHFKTPKKRLHWILLLWVNIQAHFNTSQKRQYLILLTLLGQQGSCTFWPRTWCILPASTSQNRQDVCSYPLWHSMLWTRIFWTTSKRDTCDSSDLDGEISEFKNLVPGLE